MGVLPLRCAREAVQGFGKGLTGRKLYFKVALREPMRSGVVQGIVGVRRACESSKEQRVPVVALYYPLQPLHEGRIKGSPITFMILFRPSRVFLQRLEYSRTRQLGW